MSKYGDTWEAIRAGNRVREDASVGAPADGKLYCYYCVREQAMKEAKLTTPQLHNVCVTVHDKCGCYHLCWSHAIWRSTTSAIGGHSDDCPHRGK